MPSPSSPSPSGATPPPRTLADVVRLAPEKILHRASVATRAPFDSASVALVILAAGKGTRFGQHPKCIQPVLGSPLARHSIDAFRSVASGPVVAIVGYRHEEVSSALGDDNVYVLSDDPAGGTAMATYEAFSVAGLAEANPLVVITMGDRVVPPSIFRRLLELHASGPREADLTLLTARYEPPRHVGKGRVLRDEAGRVTRIIEEKDIATEPEAVTRQALHNLTEGNCPLYVIRAAPLLQHLGRLRNDNAQGQFYLTDIIARISALGGDIRTVTTHPAEPEYDLLCSDVTRPADLALLEGVLARAPGFLPDRDDVALAAAAIRADRPPGQVASIARQLTDLWEANRREKLGFNPDEPIALGISGGRLRIAFMHPDMGRFFGPAWQMPIGAADAQGNEQIVVLAQCATDHRIHLFPLDPKFRETINSVEADGDAMFPGAEVSDWHSYEGFGTRMSETLLLSLGYFTDEEIETRRRRQQPLPPASLRVATNMRRPFSLVGNAIASLRTLRDGHLGATVQARLGRDRFQGLRLVCTGGIPQGGFSSSSALTVATKNALNALLHLGVPPDLLVHLACQAEYGTGVRAGSLDQATEQKGRSGQGTLISSNPAENYRILGTYPVPSDRFRVMFPYTVERDREAWRWSWGAYAETAGSEGALTTGEMRKLTGKAAEIAAILTRLPLDTSFFQKIETDLVDDGLLSLENRAATARLLRELPLLISFEELRQRVMAQRAWYAGELARVESLDRAAAERKADATLGSLFNGWREPSLRRPGLDGGVTVERGVPLRAMLAYLFSEVAKNCFLIHHPEQWIDCVSRSQLGDRSVALDPEKLPDIAAMIGPLEWERELRGPALLDAWLERSRAMPYDFNAGLADADLSADTPPEFHRWAGGSFFRGLALIDLAEAMLHRAFGRDVVAVRVNAAGQGDYFQVHVDTQRVAVEPVKAFLRAAVYRRFGFSPEPEFVETHPGGGALGLHLARFRDLPRLIPRLTAPTT